MPKVSVFRDVTDLTGTELLDAYEAASDKTELRKEMVRRLDPPKVTKKQERTATINPFAKGRK